jgi:DNA-binding CsgD family transcriptional regulator
MNPTLSGRADAAWHASPSAATRMAPASVTQAAAMRAGHTWLGALMDEVDLGLLVVARSGGLLFINGCAEQMMSSGDHPWASTEGGHWQLTALGAELLRAVETTLARRTRKMLRLSPAAGGQVVAVLPFDALPDAALVNLGRPQICEPLSIQCFAISHGLTSSETQVLVHLCNGLRPTEIASRQGVLMSTVRTQISALRCKAGCGSIDALIRRVAMLPPMRSALGRSLPRSTHPVQ